jgi:hypothetical protein
MANLLYLVVAIGLSTVGGVLLWFVRRRPRSMQSQMDAFSRELAALAPNDGSANRNETHVDHVEPLPIRPRAHTPGAPRANRRATNAGTARRQGAGDTAPDRRRSS